MRLKYYIPAVLLLLTVGVTAASYFTRSAGLNARIEDQALQHNRNDFNVRQDQLEYLAARGLHERIRAVLGAMGSDPSLVYAALLDESGSVMASNKFASIERSFADYLREAKLPAVRVDGLDPPGLVDANSTDRVGRVRVSDDGGSVVAVFPVAVYGSPEEPRPRSYGTLFALLDLNHEKAYARASLLRNALVEFLMLLLISLLLGWTLHRAVTARVNRLLAVTRELAAGNHTVRCRLSGSDELGELGVAFDAMAGKLGDQREELENRRRLFQSVFDAIPDALVMADSDRRITMINPGVTQTFGYDPEDLRGLTTSVLYADENDYLEQGRKRFNPKANGKVTPYEVNYRRKNGEEFSGETMGARIADPDGQVTGYLGIIRDVEERRQTLGALKRSEDTLARAQEIAHIGHWDWVIATGGLTWSDEIYRIFGLKPRQFAATYEAFLETVHPDDRDAIVQAVNDSIAEPSKSYDVEHRIIRPNGEQRIVHERGKVYCDEHGKAERMIGTVHDITEIKHAQSRLMEQERRFRATFEQAAVGIAQIGLDGRFVRVNRRLADMVGYSPETLTKLTFQDITYAPDLETDMKFVHALLAGEISTYHMENRYVHADQSLVWINLTVALVHDEQNQPEYFISVIEDISERKRIEIELEGHRGRLEELVEARTTQLQTAQAELVKQERLATLGHLTATVSHELRNPLGAMKPSLYVIRKKVGDADERMNSAVERLERNINRCDHIIDELLDFTRIRDLDTSFYMLDEWLPLLLYEQHWPGDVEVQFDAGVKNLEVEYDPNRLRRAFINVFENAVHAVQDLRDRKKEIRVSTGRGEGGRVELTVSDNGTGMPSDVRERIFEPLFSTKGFGVGLGMPAVKQIMDQHRGGIEVHTEEGRGTRVVLFLPASSVAGSGNG